LSKIKREVFIDELPRYRGNSIDWNKSVGLDVEFIHGDVKGHVNIISYKQEKNILTIKYLNRETEIDTRSFRRCGFAEVLKIKTLDYRYKTNTVINNLKLLEFIRINHGVNRYGNIRMEKGYKYECQKCGYKGEMYEYQINRKCQCQVCCNRIIEKGINDIATTHPQFVKYFVNIEDAYKVSKSSNKSINFKCPECGYLKTMTMNHLYMHGIACPKCGDGISYPEKIMFSVLEQLKIKFMPRKKFEWSSRKEYDFYIEKINCIIETHGIQHYEQTKRKGARSLKEEKSNDRFKKGMSKQNNIKEYIVIDSRKSELEWIKNEILNSKLNTLFDLSNVDWGTCEEFALSSFVKIACNLWNTGLYNTVMIHEKMRLSQGTIISYLKKGAKIGICDYLCTTNRKLEMYNLEDEKIGEFASLLDACEYALKTFDVKLQKKAISQVCTGKLKHYKGYKFKYVKKNLAETI